MPHIQVIDWEFAPVPFVVQTCQLRFRVTGISNGDPVGSARFLIPLPAEGNNIDMILYGSEAA